MAKHLPKNRMVYSSVDWNEETHDSCSKNIRLILVPSIDLRGCPTQPHPPESPGFGKADAIALGSTEQALGRAIPADSWNASRDRSSGKGRQVEHRQFLWSPLSQVPELRQLTPRRADQ